MEKARDIIIRLTPENPSREYHTTTIIQIARTMNALMEGTNQMKQTIDFHQQQVENLHGSKRGTGDSREGFIYHHCRFNQEAEDAMLSYLRQAKRLLSEYLTGMDTSDKDGTSLKLQCDLADKALKIQCALADDQALNDFRDVTGRQVWPQYRV